MASKDINASIVSAIWECTRRMGNTKADQSLGPYAEAISNCYGELFRALVESPRPDPEIPGSVSEWEQHRRPLLQAWADALDTAASSIRNGSADAALQKLVTTVDDIKKQLCAGCNPTESIIQFGEASLPADARTILQQQRSFSAETRRQQQRLEASQHHADFEAGAARARQQSSGGGPCR